MILFFRKKTLGARNKRKHPVSHGVAQTAYKFNITLLDNPSCDHKAASILCGQRLLKLYKIEKLGCVWDCVNVSFTGCSMWVYTKNEPKSWIQLTQDLGKTM